MSQGITLTLPQEMSERFGFSSPDDIVFEATDQGILLRPEAIRPDLKTIRRKMRARLGLTRQEMEVAADAGLIDRDQFYHWTPESQKRMKEALTNRKKGKTKKFDTADDLIKDLSR